MVAIRRCLAEHGPDALVGSTLYTSGEPCAMCMGAILWCRLGRLVYAASVAQLATRIDQIMISSAELAAAPRSPDLDHRRRAGGRGTAAVPKERAARASRCGGRLYTERLLNCTYPKRRGARGRRSRLEQAHAPSRIELRQVKEGGSPRQRLAE